MAIEWLYVETSVWNFLFAEDAPERRLATQEFFELVPKRPWRLAISELVIDEILDTPDSRHRERLLDAIRRGQPDTLPVSQETLDLAKKYILQGTLSQRCEVDAKHVAVAVVGGCDVILSWNLRHLVKVRTRREINAANLLNGYRTIEIATPEEMI